MGLLYKQIVRNVCKLYFLQCICNLSQRAKCEKLEKGKKCKRRKQEKKGEKIKAAARRRRHKTCKISFACFSKLR